jgi:hypothetical protein
LTSWRGLRHEIAGAWRSLRYDLERRQPRRADDEEETTDLIFPEYGTARPPRRILAAGGFGTLAVAGAVGTYFAVATGLGLLIDDGAGGQPTALPGVGGNRSAISDLGAAELGEDRPGTDPRDNGVGVGMLDKGGVIIAREGRPAGRITDAGKQAAVEEAGGGSVPAAAPTPTRTKTPSPKPTSPRPSHSTTSPAPSPSPSTSSPGPSPSASPSESPSPDPDPSSSDPGGGGGEGETEPPTTGGGGEGTDGGTGEEAP